MGKEAVHLRKVLLLAAQMEARGTSEYTVNLAKELQDSEVEVAVFGVPGPAVSRLEREGVPVRTFESLRGLRFWISRGNFLDALGELGPQIVHAQSCRAAPALKLLSRKTELPLVLTIHGVPGRLRSVRRLSRRVDGIVATTQSVREGLVNRCRVARDTIQVIHNGIDVEELSRREIPPIFQAETPVVGCVGPIEERRGQEQFVRAVSRLVRSGVEAQFVIAGQGEVLPEVRKLVGQLGLERSLTLATDFAAYEEFLGALDIVVQSSLVDVSGFSILEAMGHGRPVVAFNTGTACEMIEEGKTGLLVPKGKEEALADAIRRLITDTELARRMGQNARESVREKFNIRNIARKTLQFYAGILSETAAASGGRG